MEKKKTLIILAIILGSIALIGGGVAFAYFVFGINGNGNNEENKVEIVTNSLGTINYEIDNAFSLGDLLPGMIDVQEFTISKGDQEGKGTYEIDLYSEVDEEFNDDIAISLYKSINGNSVSVTKGTLTTSGEIAREDTLVVGEGVEKVYGPSVLTNSEMTKLEMVYFNTEELEDTKYYLVYEYKNNGNQNNQMGHDFTTKVTVRLLASDDTNNLKIKYVYAHDETQEMFPTYETAIPTGARYSIAAMKRSYYTSSIEKISGTMSNDKEVIIKYTPINDENSNGLADEEENKYNLTISYINSKTNEEISSTYTNSYLEGISYNIESPSITYYTADKSIVNGIMGVGNITEIVRYTPNHDNDNNGIADELENHTLTIEYKYSNGTTASTTYTASLAYNASYSVTSPSKNYYTVNQATVSGTMGYEDKTIVVIYTPNHDSNSNGVADEEESHTLTIQYKYNNGTTASTTHTESLAYNASYSVTSPVINGYEADTLIVSGTMGYVDKTIVVTYTKTEMAAETISNLYSTLSVGSSPMMANDDPDGNIRYIGQNPDNYVSFNGEEWRIIGVFNVDDGTGNVKPRIKLIRNESLGNIVWNEGVSGVNAALGVNQWGESTDSKGIYAGATMMQTLNGGYLNKTGSYTTIGLTEESRSLIEKAVWNTGTVDGTKVTVSNAKASDWYSAERSNNNGKKCKTSTNCNDTVVRTTTWTGKIGLMYPSDYGYATGGGSGTNNRTWCLRYQLEGWYNSMPKKNCAETSWLYNSSVTQWTITPTSDSTYSRYVVSIDSSGKLALYSTIYAKAVRPVVYLRSDVKITGGNGKSASVTGGVPYQLSL